MYLCIGSTRLSKLDADIDYLLNTDTIDLKQNNISATIRPGLYISLSTMSI
jgi:hypothetical protein